MAFMFESTYMFKVTEFAQNNNVDKNYYKCWESIKSYFHPEKL